MQLRWGICGTGKICQDFVNAIRLLSPTEHAITAVGASNAERAEKFAKTNNIPVALQSYDDLMKYQEIDIIYVGVVNAFHKDMVLKALNNGKNILCEKPLGVNAAEAKQMVQLAREKKLFLMEAFWSKFFPVYKLLRNELDSGTIGEPKLVVANFGQLFNETVLSKDLGNCAINLIGVYCIMLSVFVFKEKPREVHVSGFLNKIGTDDTTNITLLYDNGKMFQCMVSSTVELENRAIIYGSKGQISIPSYFWCPSEIVTPIGRKMFPLPTYPKEMKFNFDNSEGLSYEAQAVRECILSGQLECNQMPLDESIMIAEITDAVRQKIGIRFSQDT